MFSIKKETNSENKQQLLNKYYEILGRIKSLEKSSVSFSLDEEKRILSNINIMLLSDTNFNKGVEALDKLSESLKPKEIIKIFSEWTQYFKDNIFNKKINEIKIQDFTFIRNYVIKIINFINTNSLIVSSECSDILEDFFMIIYKSIELELINNNFESEILDLVLNSPMLSYNINLIIERKVDELKSSSYLDNNVLNNLKDYIQRRKIVGLNNMVDKTIIMYLMKNNDSTLEMINKRITSLYSDISFNNSNIESKIHSSKSLQSIIEKLNRFKEVMNKGKKDIKKNIISMFLSASLLVSAGVGINSIIKDSSYKTAYKTETYSYVKQDDKLLEPTFATTYAPLEEHTKTLTILGEKDISSRKKVVYSLLNIETEKIEDYFKLDLDLLKDNIIYENQRAEYKVGTFKGIIKTISIIKQDLNDSKIVFDKNDYNKKCVFLIILEFFLLCFFPVKQLLQAKNLNKSIKNVTEDYNEELNDIMEELQLLRELNLKNEELISLYNKFVEIGITDILDDESMNEFNKLINRSKENYEFIKKLELK